MNEFRDDLEAFEAHTQFRTMLQKYLSANHIYRVTTFAYRYEEHAEELFAALMEELKECLVIYRSNFFYLVDFLYKQGIKTNDERYVSMVKAHLDEIVYCVINCNPKMLKEGKVDPEGLANVASVTKVLNLWTSKGAMSKQTVDPLLKFLSLCAEKASEFIS